MARRTFTGVVLTLLVASCPCWPDFPEPIDECTIPVFMDIPMYAEILDPDELVIKLEPVAATTYKGCVDIEILSNFDAELRCGVTSTGKVQGRYSCWLDDPTVPATFCGTAVRRRVCVRADKVNIVQAVPEANVHIADITVTIVPDHLVVRSGTVEMSNQPGS